MTTTTLPRRRAEQDERAQCRRCRARLTTPVSNPLDAFCCRGCHRIFYRAICVICEKPKSGTGAACSHPKCRAELAAKKRFGTTGRLLPTSRKKSGSKSDNSIALAAASGAVEANQPTCRIIAGPALSSMELHLATVGAGFGELDRKLNRKHWLEAERKETEPGGYFSEPEWREVVSPEGVRWFVAERASGGRAVS